MALGSDIAMVFDQCSPYPASRFETQSAADRTYRWGQRMPGLSSASGTSIIWYYSRGLFDIRKENALKMIELKFPGYAIGGLSVGEPKSLMYEILDSIVPLLPAENQDI